MKLILLLSLLKICLANNSIIEEIHPPDAKERIWHQPLTNRRWILSENQGRRYMDWSADKVPGMEIDAAGDNRHVDLRILHPAEAEYLPRKLRSSTPARKIRAKQSKFAVMKIHPTSFIGLEGKNELAGPEGKIVQVLAQSINTSLIIDDKESRGLQSLNLLPITHYGSWSLVYHPYRKLPLVPVLHRASSTEAQVTFCLLTMLTIIIIMLMHVMRNLIKIHDMESRDDALQFLKCIALPKGFLGGVQSFFYVCLAFTFFMNLGIVLEIIFREKFGKDSFEKIRNFEDIDKLNLTPLFTTKECLRELVINRSNKHYCIVSEDLGKELIRRYGHDGKGNLMQLVDSMYFEYQWRGLQLDTFDLHVERLNDVQLKLLQSGLLLKWYNDEMILNLAGEEKYMRQARTTWSSGNRDKNARLMKFIYFLVLLIINGCILAFLVYIAEFLLLRKHFNNTKEIYARRH